MKAEPHTANARVTTEPTNLISRFTAPCKREALHDIRLHVAKSMEEIGLSSPIKDQIVLAVDEATANAIIHGNNCDEGRSIVIELYFHEQTLTVRIFDIGDFEFDARLLERDIESLLRERAKGGLGLRLIHALMDDVRFYHEGDLHVCTLTKYVA